MLDRLKSILSKRSGPNGEGTSLGFKLSLMAALCIPVILETLDYTGNRGHRPAPHRLSIQPARSPEQQACALLGYCIKFTSKALALVVYREHHVSPVLAFGRLVIPYIGTAYLLSSTVFIPFFGSLADIYGRHPALQLSLLFFTVGSALSTGANSMPMMLAGRGIAGIGAAGLTAVVRIILADSRSLDDNNWQMSILMVLYSIGYCIGPVIGGALIAVSFRWIFAINLPACVVASAVGFLLLRKKTKKGRASQQLPHSTADMETWFDKLMRIDWIGSTLFMGGGILLLLALNWGSTESWSSAQVIACFVVGGLLFVACAAYELVLERYRLRESAAPPPLRMLLADPLVPMEVLRSYDVCAVLYSCFVQGMVMMVMFYFVAIFMVIVTGLSPTQAGVQLIYFAPGMGAGSMISIWITKPSRSVVIGSIITTVGLGLVSMAVEQNKQHLVDGFMVMTGAGVGLCLSSAVVHVRFSQPDERQAVVTALTLFMRSFGGTVGLAQCGAVMNAKVSSHIAHAIISGQLDPAALGGASLDTSGGLSSVQGIDALPAAAQAVVKRAFAVGTQYSFISLVPWGGIAVVLALFLRPIPDTDKERRDAAAEAKEGEKEGDEETPAKGSEKSAEQKPVGWGEEGVDEEKPKEVNKAQPEVRRDDLQAPV
ncbi:MFS general substrate transporter [Gloeophyllum trabeum ATCC 11539]|uniref:MFS general substrate transporter n=1 Tax=Gloeophyllum trabeum (strain ATCC 11539 / FP-39264 / Madison 617) TaxID=670483 RepID=S7Q6N4_GLOTA|nr:MFS general substrate transporter [Gloeophyllum trabeum ATCC 11539]EPQ55182.1 MFS general substrate transporter [Gloeophyllum trabeum ATCC 11539]